MKNAAYWYSTKPLAEINMPAWIEAIQADAVADLVVALRKYQGRYAGTPHAQKDYEQAKAALDAVRHLKVNPPPVRGA